MFQFLLKHGAFLTLILCCGIFATPCSTKTYHMSQSFNKSSDETFHGRAYSTTLHRVILLGQTNAPFQWAFGTANTTEKYSRNTCVTCCDQRTVMCTATTTMWSEIQNTRTASVFRIHRNDIPRNFCDSSSTLWSISCLTLTTINIYFSFRRTCRTSNSNLPSHTKPHHTVFKRVPYPSEVIYCKLNTTAPQSWKAEQASCV